MTDSTPGSDVSATPDRGVPSNAPDAAPGLGQQASVTVDMHSAPADGAATPAAAKPTPRTKKKTTPRATTGASADAAKRPAAAKKTPAAAKRPPAKRPAAKRSPAKTVVEEASTETTRTPTEEPTTASAAAEAAADVALVIPPRPPLPPRPPVPPLPPVPAVVAAQAVTVPATSTGPEHAIEPEAEAAAAAPAEPDAVVETESVEAPAPAVEAEPVIEPGPAVEAEPVIEPGPAVEAEPMAEAEPIEVEAAAEPDAGIVPEREVIADPEPVDEPDAVVEAEPEPVVEAAPEPVAEPELEAEPELAVTETVVVLDDLTDGAGAEPALRVTGLRKAFGGAPAVDGIDLVVPAGSFYGLVGPNGAGKTTTLSMIAGLLRADAGEIRICGVDARTKPREAKRLVGVLPDRLRTFDRLTGRQLLTYSGMLRGLSPDTVDGRVTDLARAFDLTQALGRPVSDYSAGMTKKVMIAGALIHSPRLLVLDEPFEAVDPVSSGVILDILSTYVANGGTVLLSSHGMDLVERVCTRVAVMVSGQVLAEGTVDDVRGQQTLEERFLDLIGGPNEVEGLEWLHTFSD